MSRATRGKSTRTENPTGKRLLIRLDEDERDRLERAAHANRQNYSDFVRDAIADRADASLED